MDFLGMKLLQESFKQIFDFPLFTNFKNEDNFCKEILKRLKYSGTKLAKLKLKNYFNK